MVKNQHRRKRGKRERRWCQGEGMWAMWAASGTLEPRRRGMRVEEMIKEKLNTFKPRMWSRKSVIKSESVDKNILGWMWAASVCCDTFLETESDTRLGVHESFRTRFPVLHLVLYWPEEFPQCSCDFCPSVWTPGPLGFGESQGVLVSKSKEMWSAGTEMMKGRRNRLQNKLMETGLCSV